jgi:hypothetical protein
MKPDRTPLPPTLPTDLDRALQLPADTFGGEGAPQPVADVSGNHSHGNKLAAGAVIAALAIAALIPSLNRDHTSPGSLRTGQIAAAADKVAADKDPIENPVQLTPSEIHAVDQGANPPTS